MIVYACTHLCIAMAIAISSQLKAAQRAARQLPLYDVKAINRMLNDLADLVEQQADAILAHNARDLAHVDPSDHRYHRVRFTQARIAEIAEELRDIAMLSYPVGKKLLERTLPNGLQVAKVRVPLGVIGIVYDARPNITLEVFGLCIKSGNACVLQGGQTTAHTNMYLMELIQQALFQNNISRHVASLLATELTEVDELVKAVGLVDLIIPIGSRALIEEVKQKAAVPVIETGAGVVHTYFDKRGLLSIGQAIVLNAKTRNYDACNALDCLLIHEKRAEDLPELLAPLADKGVIVHADERAFKALNGHYPAELLQAADPALHYGREFNAAELAVRTVYSMEEAMEHIARYGSRHSEAIITQNEKRAQIFLQKVDAAAVFHNAPTSFTDGAQFGLGAEIGISAQKLHARGPMALEELTSYKWVVKGHGQVRK